MQSPALPNIAPTGIKQAPQVEAPVDYNLDAEQDTDGKYLAKTTPTMPHRFVIIVKGEGDYSTEMIREKMGDPSSDRKLNAAEIAFAQKIGLNVVNAAVPPAATQAAQADAVKPGVPNLAAFQIPNLPQLSTPPLASATGAEVSPTTEGLQIPSLPVLSTT